MDDSRANSWTRFAVEGAVIVVSILLAFAIDAWWDERNARNAEIEQLVRVAQELQANSQRLQQKLEVLNSAIEGTEELISWMGPEPIDVSPAVYHGQWAKFFSIGMYSVLRGAVQEYLASGTAGDSRHATIRDALWKWHSEADELEKQYQLLRVTHARISDYADDRVPSLYDIVGSGFFSSQLASKFPYDQDILLSDFRFESRLATYLIRLRFVSIQADRMLEMQAELLAMIENATAD